MRYVLLSVLLAGCGTQHHSDNNPAPDVAAEGDPATDTDTVADTQPLPYSMALDSAADLPACDDAHQHQLVYLLDSHQFQTCNAGAWSVVSITPTITVADIVAALAHVVLGKALTEQPADVQALLARQFLTVSNEIADSDYCKPTRTVAGVLYSNNTPTGAYSDGASKIQLEVDFRDGVADSVYYKVDDKPPVSRMQPCS